ncbi:ATP-binding protein, partial [Paraburkholderia humisilvae]
LCAVKACSNQAGSPCCTISPHNRALHINQVMLRATLVDDFGLKPMRTPEDEDFHDLIAERYERASTVLTSNLDFTEWGDAFATNKMPGAATLDRLRHAAYRVVLDGESYRVPRPMPDSKSTLAKGGKNKDS